MSNLSEQAKKLSDGALTIPNLLSAIRIVLVPVILALFLNGKCVAAIIIFAISGLTDLFDGKIARKFNQVSELGKILDPIADKLTQMALAAAFFFAYHGSDDKLLHAFSWVFWFYVAKELTMLVCGFILISMNITPSAAIIYGKVATMAYYIVMGLLLVCAPIISLTASLGVWTMPSILVVILVSISVVLTLIAFISYIPGSVAQYKEKKASK